MGLDGSQLVGDLITFTEIETIKGSKENIANDCAMQINERIKELTGKSEHDVLSFQVIMFVVAIKN